GPDVPRHAARIGAVEHRAADRIDARGVRVVDDVQRAAETGDREVILVGQREIGLRELVVDVVGPDVRQIAAHAGDDAEVGVLDVAGGAASLDVAAQDLRLTAGVGQAGGRVDQHLDDVGAAIGADGLAAGVDQVLGVAEDAALL